MKKKIEEIKKYFTELRHRFFKSKINEFIKSLHKIKIQKNLFCTKNKRDSISLYNPKKYYDCDDTEYRGIRDIRNLFGEVDENYHKPRKTKSAFNGN